MPDLVIAQNVPQAQIDAIVAAFVERNGPVPVDAQGNPVMSDAAFARQKIREFIKSVVQLSQREVAAKAAAATAATQADTTMNGF